MKKEEKAIIYFIPILFLLGAVSHFIYELTGKLNIIGSIFPVNESIWEHLKLILLPTVLVWTIYYLVKKKNLNMNINKNRWFTSMLVSLVSSMLLITTLYYFLNGAFNIESVIVDIILFLISIILGQFLGICTYRSGLSLNYMISIFIVVIIFVLFIIFTYNTPKLPIFFDSNSNVYGIEK